MADDTYSLDFDIDDYLRFGVLRFNGVEGISRPFHFEIYLASKDFQETFGDNLIGRSATLRIHRGKDFTFITGTVSRFLWIGENDNLTAFYAELVPNVWYLTQQHGCRIFRDLSAPDIIKEVLEKDAKLTTREYEFRLRKKHSVREYCVQYRESTFNFISRLMEEEGIYYYFKHHHTPTDLNVPPAERPYPWWHTIVMGDDPSSHDYIPDNKDTPNHSDESKKNRSKVKFHKPTDKVAAEEHIYEFNYGYQIRPGQVMLRDFNYERNRRLEGLSHIRTGRFGFLEFYDYPGKFSTLEDGNRLAETRLEEMRTKYAVGIGRSNCIRLVPGAFFTLDGHSQKEFNQKEYLLLSVTHAGSQRKSTEKESEGAWGNLLDVADKGIDALLSSLPSIGPLSAQQLYHEMRKGLTELLTKDVVVYRNEFECIPSSIPYRPPRLTPKPAVQGPHTAIVVGPKDEKLHMDELGRAKVRFHWDLDQKDDDKRTCYIRVAYNYAGSDHGFQFHPLVGDEVVVEFLEGDPDKPLITGSVYNGDNRPPLKPENKIENIILTPYQHRLLLSDRESSITLNTGGNEVIQMIDDKETSEYGKQIKISTADNHYIRMAKGAKASGIGIRTEKGHAIVMEDGANADFIGMVDRENNLWIELNTRIHRITVKNETDQEILIDCQKGKVRVIGGGVEVVGGGVTITGSEAVKINSSGQVTISAPTIQLKGNFIHLDSDFVLTSGLLMCTTLDAVSVVAKSYTPGMGNVK